MWPVLGAGLLLLGLLMSTDRKKPATDYSAREPMIKLVREEARRQGVAEPTALAFAEAESGFNPAAAGDLYWADKRPELYEKLVLNNPLMAANPARLDRRAWHSYGLFQLLAPHHVRSSEHPNVLYDPKLNAQRGIAYIKALLKKHDNDIAQARLAYAGALNANAGEQERVLTRFARIYQAWHDFDAQGLA